MASVNFGNFSADMRLADAGGYGMAPLLAMNAYFEGFVFASDQIIADTDGYIEVRFYDPAGGFFTISARGTFSSNVITSISVQAAGVVETITGDFYVDGLGNAAGAIRTVSSRLVQTGELLYSYAGLSLNLNYDFGPGLPYLTTELLMADADSVTGGSGDDHLLGFAGADTLRGGAGMDSLDGGVGADLLIGGMGNDLFIVDDAGDVAQELAAQGTDQVDASASHWLAANVENLALTGDAAIDGHGNALANLIVGNAAANLLDGGAGADTLTGLAGDDRYVIDSLLDVVIDSAGDDTILTALQGYALEGSGMENLTLLGAALSGAGDDLANRVTGNAFANQLLGHGGADTLDGGAGLDTLVGGAGDDWYLVDRAADSVVEALDGGIDAVFSTTSFVLAANLEALTLTGTQASSATGNALGNRILGNAAANIINGGAGADSMFGGDGADVYSVDNPDDEVVEYPWDEGVDTLRSSISRTLDAGVENLVLLGGADLLGTGNLLDNHLAGNSGRNFLDGGPGFDSYAGGAGDDTYVVESHLPTTRSLFVEGQEGNYVAGPGDTSFTADDGPWIVSLFDYTSDDLVDYLYFYYVGDAGFFGLTFSSDDLGTNLAPGDYTDAQRAAFAEAGHPGLDLGMNGRGNNQVFGSFSIQQIDIDYSGDAPVLLRFSATFSASGFLTEPPMLGTVQYDVGLDLVSETVTELANAGQDTVWSDASYRLGDNVENLKLTGAGDIDGTGNALSNILYAGAGDNILDGGLGTDTASYLYATAAVNASLALATAQATGGSGSDTLLGIENLTGSNFADNFTGNAQVNKLEGGLGDDTLNGGAGNDSLLGGTGQDTASYSGAAAGVVASVFTMTATGGAGADTLNAIEHLIGSAFGDKLTGNSQANRIEGGAGNDTIGGGGGADSMIGGDGLDTYAVDHAADQVIESNALATGGADLVNSYLGAYTLTANVENGRILNAAAANLTGNELGNTLFAGAGDNVLVGGAGIDTVSYLYAAGAVNASLAIVGAQATGGSGADSFIGVERLSGSNFADQLTGDGQVNALSGGNGNDTLTSGAGNDLLIGGAGQDSLTGGTGADRFDYNAANESGISNTTWDRISDFQGALGDKIDLATIDADTATAGDQAFSAPVNSPTTFSAMTTFTSAGQLYFDQPAHVLYGNTDADPTAEFAIELVGVASLALAHLAA